jgi:FtsP/CotA-like multicopper oxidase with cupredoxin domain
VLALVLSLASASVALAQSEITQEDPFPGFPELGWEAPPLPSGPDGVLPARTCVAHPTLVGGYVCIVFIQPATITMADGVSLPGLGSAPNSWTAATVPGPTMIVQVGDKVYFSVYNRLTDQNVSLSIPGMPLVPDFIGAAALGSKHYGPITVTEPGTYIYEAGFTSNGSRQAGTGIYGTLIVRPAAPLQAYNDAESAYTDEAVLVFSEVDVDLFNNPATFEMTGYSPEYRLVNGKTYNQVQNILVTPGSTLLLRMVNAGIEERSIGVLGLNLVQAACPSTTASLQGRWAPARPWTCW